jgi:hypothetical protein
VQVAGVVIGIALVCVGLGLLRYRVAFSSAAQSWRRRSGSGNPESQTPQLAAIVGVGFIVLGIALVVGLLTGVLHAH